MGSFEHSKRSDSKRCTVEVRWGIFIENLTVFFIPESETDLTDLVHDLDLEDVNDTGYKRDINVKITNGFYYQNMAYMNDNVRLFADY